MSQRYDLAVVGAGILGTWHAYHALERGKKVLLLERDLRPNGATVRNFGQVVASGCSGKWFPRAQYTVQLYHQLQSQTDLTVRQNGTLYLASDESEMAVLEELIGRYQDWDYPAQLMTAAACQKHLPALRPDYAVGGLYFPQEVSVEPRKMIHLLQAWMERNPQLNFQRRSPVREIEARSDHHRLVTSDGKAWEADRVVVTTGHDFQTLFPELYRASKLKISKLQMLATPPLPQVHLPGNILTGLSIRRYESFREMKAWQNLSPRPEQQEYVDWGIHLLFKQRIDGSIIIGDSHEYIDVDRGEPFELGLRPRINQLILEEAQRIIDLPDWTMAQSWVGYYSQVQEGDLLEKWLSDRLLILTGIGGKGMTSGAGLAKEMIAKMYG